MKYTFKKICEMASLTESTGRSYRDRFEKYFKASGAARTRKYGPETAETLKTIRRLYSEGLDTDQISDFLFDQQYAISLEKLAKQEGVNNKSEIQKSIELIRGEFLKELSKRDEIIIKLEKELYDINKIIQAIKPTKEQNEKAWRKNDWQATPWHKKTNIL